jgi:hypothetical protein
MMATFVRTCRGYGKLSSTGDRATLLKLTGFQEKGTISPYATAI